MVTQRGIEATHSDQSYYRYERLLLPQRGTKAHRRIAAVSRFILNSAEKSLSFFKTLRKANTFEWGPCQLAFEELKAYLARLPLLVKPSPGDTLYLLISRSPGCQLCYSFGQILNLAEITLNILTVDRSSSWNSPSSATHSDCTDKAYDDTSRIQPSLAQTQIQPSCARDCHDSSSLRTTPILSELGTQVIPTKPPRLPYDIPRVSSVRLTPVNQTH
ncbi:UNVERIFIED_CONTAM: hypothetical protein Slati_3835900 [Sesamum latifolium]|uniref:Reverse transcriptase/retrotransposon-derived protein RNase H-like domain-containing protein n=1 Tax=Sesamum latifolium TaxID=2727402 RepID=A0AAW2TJS0_9LAMI